MCDMLYINKKNSPVFYISYFNQVTNRKDLKSRYFVLVGLKTDSPFNFTLKDMYIMSYTQTFIFLEKCPLDRLRILKCVRDHLNIFKN